MADLSMLGIGSNGATAELMRKLTEVENRRLQPVQRRQKNIESKISAWGKICSSLQTLLEKSKILNGDVFSAMKISKNKAFSATSTGVMVGTHNIKVIELAQNHTLSFATKEKTDSPLGNSAESRVLIIGQSGKSGKGEPITISFKQNETSLEGIAKAIEHQDTCIRADVRKVGSNGEHCLVLMAKDSGKAGEMTISVEGDDQLAGFMSFTPESSNQKGISHLPASTNGMKEAQKAQDAQLVVDGNTYFRSSNIIKDILSGITLMPDNRSADIGLSNGETLTLNPDESAVQKAVKEFINAFNDLITQSSTLSKFTPTNYSSLKPDEIALPDSTNGPLAGESLLSSLMAQLRRDVGSNYGNSDMTALTVLGIKVDAKTSKLELDGTKLKDKTHENPQAIRKLFMGQKSENGLVSMISDHIKEYIGSGSSADKNIIKDETKNLEEQKKAVKKELEHTEHTIQDKLRVYQKQFQKLDVMLTQMDLLSKQLTSMLVQLQK